MNDDERARWQRADEDARRRYWEEVEEAEERSEEEARLLARREAAIERMETWFYEQFEDPENETPRDSDDQSYIYPWGGPFDAADVLHDNFRHDYDEKWIAAVVDRVEREGVVEWAPTSSGDYYQHPEPEQAADERTREQLTRSVLHRLDQLEATVANWPGVSGNMGHNRPPDEVGVPPYGELEPNEIIQTVRQTRIELANPDPVRLTRLSVRFETWSQKLGAWLAKKGDLAVDELIKSGVAALSWTAALSLFSELAADLMTLAGDIAARF